MLRRTLIGEIRAWDIRLDYFQFKKDLITAFSSKNLVLNNGFNSQDASNTVGYNRFNASLENFNHIDLHFPDFITLNPIIKSRFISKNSIWNRLITFTFKLIKLKN